MCSVLVDKHIENNNCKKRERDTDVSEWEGEEVRGSGRREGVGTEEEGGGHRGVVYTHVLYLVGRRGVLGTMPVTKAPSSFIRII